MPRESTILVYRSTTTDIPTGLTFGEPAFSGLTRKLFVGDQTGNSIWVGAEITAGSIATNSTILVPTQSAVKSYVDGVVGGGSVVNSVNGTGGSITITGDGSSQQVSVSGTTTTITNRLATTSVTGVASFNSTRFSVVNGAVDLAAPYQITGDTVAAVGSASVTRSGNVATIDNRLATTSLTGVASFNPSRFTVSSGAVDLLYNSIGVRGSVGGAGSPVALGSTLTVTSGGAINVQTSYDGSNATLTVANMGVVSANGATGAITVTGDAGSQQVSVSETTTTITNRLATTSLTGVASFSSTNFDVAAGAVSIKTGGVPNAALANSSFTLRDEVGATDTISLGDTLTITGGRGVDFIRTTTDTYEVRGVTATSSVLGVASFNATRFSVSNGAVDLAAPYQITGDTVAAVGSALVTRSGNVAHTQVLVKKGQP